MCVDGRHAVRTFLDRLWPQVTAKHVLRRLYADADSRAEACSGVLTARGADLLGRGAGPLKPSAADMVLLDELVARIRPLPPERLLGHVVVDEAQDLSPMQCRAIARRTPDGALTVLGDLAQSSCQSSSRCHPHPSTSVFRPRWP